MASREKDSTDRTVYDGFDALRFPLILLVIYIHNADLTVAIGTAQVGPGGGQISTFLVRSISEGWARAAVPLFYFMAAYLMFFRFQPTAAGYVRKWRSRIQTLLVPYVIWTVLVALVLLAAQWFPPTSGLFNSGKTPLASLPPLEFLGAVFGFPGFPVAYQFWFIRDLIILTLMSPLIYFVAASAAGWCVLLALVVCWLFSWWPVPLPGLVAVLFYFVGVMLAARGVMPFFGRMLGTTMGAAALVLFVLNAVDVPTPLPGLYGRLGVAAALVFALSLPLAARSVLHRLAPLSFFVFALHEPLLTLLRKIGLRLLPSDDLVAAAFYLGLPCVVAVMCVGAYYALRTIWPAGLRVLAGNRAAAQGAEVSTVSTPTALSRQTH